MAAALATILDAFSGNFVGGIIVGIPMGWLLARLFGWMKD